MRKGEAVFKTSEVVFVLKKEKLQGSSVGKSTDDGAQTTNSKGVFVPCEELLGVISSFEESVNVSHQNIELVNVKLLNKVGDFCFLHGIEDVVEGLSVCVLTR
jgi:sporulation protein YlmC with PRC-barrel domain